MIRNMLNLCVVLGLFGSIYATFAIKNSANAAIFQLTETKYQITQEQNNIHVLKAEIAFLSSPSNIRKLANQHLNLEQIKVSHIIPYSQIGLVDNKSTDVFQTEKTKRVVNVSMDQTSNVRWRYKQPIYKQVKHDVNIKPKQKNLKQ